MSVSFSIIIPVYNAEKYIKECLDSVARQTYANAEVILVDDGSTDATKEICDEYAKKDARFKVVHKANGGVVAARWCGVSLSRGEYVIFVDGDDWIAEDFVSLCAERIEKTGAEIVCFGAKEVCGDFERQILPYPPYGFLDAEAIEKDVFPYLIEDASGKYFSPVLWAKAFKKELFEKYAYKEGGLTMGEDLACVKPCVFHAKSLYVSEKIAYYYRTDNVSLTRASRSLDWEGPKEIGMHLEKHIDTGVADMQMQIYRCVVHNLFNVAVSKFRDGKKYGEVKAEIKERLLDPYYAKAIEKCEYARFTKGAFALMALRKKRVFLMKLYFKLTKKVR